MPLETINAETLKSWMNAGGCILVDVRESEEYVAGYIKGAVFMPLSLCDHGSAPCNPDKKIVFHCKMGGRSEKAAIAWLDMWPERTAYNFVGGPTEWVEAGYDLVVPDAA